MTGLLFAHQATIQEVILRYRDIEIPALVRSLGAEQVLTGLVDDLVAGIIEELTLATPVLDRTAIEATTSEVLVDVSGDPRRPSAIRNARAEVPGTEYTISVPFTGDPRLFQHGFVPPGYGGAQEGVIDHEHSRLLLSERGAPLSGEDARRRFDQRLDRIEETLSRVRQQTERWNATDLPRLSIEAIERRKAKLENDQRQAASLGYKIASRRPTAPGPPPSAPGRPPADEIRPAEPAYDLFISHASEDKSEVAQPLYDRLTAKGYKVWYDRAVLTMGDSLNEKINEGLRVSRYGVVVLSRAFFRKRWPQDELNGLTARQSASGEKVILPIWHKVAKADVLKLSPILADKLAPRTSDGLDEVLRMIEEVIGSRAAAVPIPASEPAAAPVHDAPASAERRQWMNKFQGTSCRFADGKTVRLAWDGPLDELKTRPPRIVTSEELDAIHCCLCAHEDEPLQPRWQYVDDPTARVVWEVDEGYEHRNKLRSPIPRHAQAFLTVAVRKESGFMPFCTRCGLTRAGNYCEPCGTPDVGPVKLKQHCS